MNRLAQETSPYLLQHAHNPVDWYPWSAEALTRANTEGKPILLSVGYSACHWCHVMERESFENAAIADLMNRDFVCIKVDREERPDIDAIYMGAVQAMTGQGGWPMTVFLTPDGKPFYGGTYFPPEDRYGRPGFPRLLEAVAEAWQTKRGEIEAQGTAMLEQMNAGSDLSVHLDDAVLHPSLLENAFTKLATQFDHHEGGFGFAPKFPQPANLDFLLRCYARTKQPSPLAMAELTLQKMALGGIYDQLGGGFHRYSTDQTWLVPHFEKMLYDNAQLAQTYARCWQATGKSFYRGVAEETLEYVLREMTSPEGGFYSAQDADSEGEEGKFFVWSPEEIAAVLGERDAAVFSAFYDVTRGGNWEGASILHVVMDAQTAADQFGLSLSDAAAILDGARAKLLAAREQRVKPGLDDKILTAWNGMMLAAFAECGAAFGRQDFLDAAIKNADFVLERLSLRDDEKRLRLRRTVRNGEAKLNGYLEDYAFFADGLLTLYEATGEVRWLQTAGDLMQTMLETFWDAENGGFFATSRDHETLIQRLKDWDDNATPSGNSVAVEVLLKMAVLQDKSEYRQRAAQVLRRLGTALAEHPYGFARILGALDFFLSSPKEIAIVGDLANADTLALLRTVYETYLPNKVVALGGHAEADAALVPLLADRPLGDGKPTAYVCESYACKEPVTSSEVLRQQLRQ